MMKTAAILASVLGSAAAFAPTQTGTCRNENQGRELMRIDIVLKRLTPSYFRWLPLHSILHSFQGHNYLERRKEPSSPLLAIS